MHISITTNQFYRWRNWSSQNCEFSKISQLSCITTKTRIQLSFLHFLFVYLKAYHDTSWGIVCETIIVCEAIKMSNFFSNLPVSMEVFQQLTIIIPPVINYTKDLHFHIYVTYIYSCNKDTLYYYKYLTVLRHCAKYFTWNI